MSEEQKIRPKGSMCANCTHKDETCNLDFASMPKISRDADGWDVVRCTGFERAEKVKDVHTEHCCSRHGCKYGKDDECTVVLGISPQSYTCEFCDDPEEKRIAELEEQLAKLQEAYDANTAIMHARTRRMNILSEELERERLATNGACRNVNSLNLDLFEAVQALKRIADINKGPDRGSGEWRANCASQIAADALARLKRAI